MRAGMTKLMVTVVLVTALVSASYGAEIETRYATLVYAQEDLLKTFNKEVRLGGLSYLVRNRTSITVSDEVKNKVDAIIEKVQSVLAMFPKMPRFKIVLLSSTSDVAKVYKALYLKNADYIAFYSPREKTVYVSVDDASLHVFAHELAHVVIDHYFGIAPPTHIHEVLAQYVEAHLED